MSRSPSSSPRDLDSPSRQGDESELPQPRPAPASEADAQLPLAEDELPVVARMVIEVRSDGVKTVARGALEDFQSGQQIAIHTDAMTTADLSSALAQSLLATGSLAREALKQSARSLVPSPRAALSRLRRRLSRGSSSDASPPADPPR